MKNELTKPKKRKKRRPYPPAYRQERAELIRKTRPWEQSTGPRSAAGKDAAAQNALKGGWHTATWRAMRRVLRAQRRFLRGVIARQPPQNPLV